MTQMTNPFKVPYSYLQQQFDPEGADALSADIFKDIRSLVQIGDYTLGSWVRRFEEAVAEKYNVKHCIGVNSGTDAIILSLNALGVGPGDVVITPPNSFVATTGAIVATGASPMFIDVGDDYQMDMDQAVHRRVKAAVPVHLTGLAKYYDHWENTVHDAAQAVGARYRLSKDSPWIEVAQAPQVACFSLHPLKNLNVWGDGGFITTDSDDIATHINLRRNHGLIDRDHVGLAGVNSRLDSIQSIVAYHGLKEIDEINCRRRDVADRYFKGLAGLEQVQLQPIDFDLHEPVFHTFIIQAEQRDELMEYLTAQGVESKIHYPISIHRQAGYQYLGYRAGDFPKCESQEDRILTLPIHQYLTKDQVDFVIDKIRGFYSTR